MKKETIICITLIVCGIIISVAAIVVPIAIVFSKEKYNCEGEFKDIDGEQYKLKSDIYGLSTIFYIKTEDNSDFGRYIEHNEVGEMNYEIQYLVDEIVRANMTGYWDHEYEIKKCEDNSVQYKFKLKQWSSGIKFNIFDHDEKIAQSRMKYFESLRPDIYIYSIDGEFEDDDDEDLDEIAIIEQPDTGTGNIEIDIINHKQKVPNYVLGFLRCAYFIVEQIQNNA